METSDKTWSTGGENGKLLQVYCHKNAMNKMKRQKDMTQEDGPPRSAAVQHASGEGQRANTNSSKKDEVSGPKQR